MPRLCIKSKPPRRDSAVRASTFWRLWAPFWPPRGAQESPREPRRPQNEARSDPREPKSLPKGVQERPKELQELEKLIFTISIPLCSGIGGSSTPGPPGTSTLGPWTSKKREKMSKNIVERRKNAKTSPTESRLRQKSEPESQKE